MLEDVDRNSEEAAGVDLPHSGEELVRWVQVLLKTSGDDGADDLKGLVHQASVRAEVVVGLIEELKNRGHRAYQSIDMAKVRCKALSTLPENGVPPEIMQLLKISNADDSVDKLQIQKEATPVPGRCQSDQEAAHIFDAFAPNAVVCERSTDDGVDVVAQRAAAFQDIGAQLTKGRATKVAVSAGNSMLDQFKPWYYGVAFAFMFSFCSGMPDYPHFQDFCFQCSEREDKGHINIWVYRNICIVGYWYLDI